MSTFVILVHEADPGAWERATPQQVETTYAAHRVFDAAVRERGKILAGEALAPAGAAVVGGRPTGAPYDERGEAVTGFYVVDLPDLDTAVELATLLPSGYSLDIREPLDLEGY